MAAGKFDFTIEQGSTFEFELTVLDDSTPVDITGMTARLQARRGFDSAPALIDISTTSGGISFTDPTAGKMVLFLNATATALLPGEETLVYDLELVFLDSEVGRLLMGDIKISAEVTK